MKYKAIICDIDGTLVNSDDLIVSPKVINAINSAKKSVFVTVATSRAYTEIHDFLTYFIPNAPIICSGGAQIIDIQTKEVFFEKALSLNAVHSLGKIAERLDIQLEINNNGSFLTYTRNIKLSPLFKPLQMYSQTPVLPTIAEKFQNEAKKIADIDVRTATAYEENKVWIIITHPDATKQYAVLKLAEILGISTEEMIGVGDHYNDFPLLMACGLKVAMGNAVDDLKAIADYIAPSVDEDGVADVIEKFILN